jgi:hypothetical protein
MKILRYQGLLLQVERLGRRQAAPGARIVVREWEDGRLELRYRGNKIAWQKISSVPVSAKPEPQPQLPRPRVRPASDHPWYRGYQGMRTPHQGTYR